MVGRRARRDVLDRIAGFLKEERRLTRRVGAHLARMRGVVAADAVDAPHREHLARAGDRQHRLRDREHRLAAARCVHVRTAARATGQRGQASDEARRQHCSSIHPLSPIQSWTALADCCYIPAMAIRTWSYSYFATLPHPAAGEACA